MQGRVALFVIADYATSPQDDLVAIVDKLVDRGGRADGDRMCVQASRNSAADGV
jgi:hypothetical protein